MWSGRAWECRQKRGSFGRRGQTGKAREEASRGSSVAEPGRVRGAANNLALGFGLAGGATMGWVRPNPATLPRVGSRVVLSSPVALGGLPVLMAISSSMDRQARLCCRQTLGEEASGLPKPTVRLPVQAVRLSDQGCAYRTRPPLHP